MIGAIHPASERAGTHLAWAALTLLGLGSGGAAEAQVVYTFEQASYAVTETAGAVEVCVVRVGSLAQRIDTLVSTVDGTATSSFGAGGIDFFPWNQVSFQFPAGVARRCGALGIFDDQLEEGVEQFTVRIVHVFPGGQVGSPSEATVSILDDESPPEDLVFRITDNGHRWGDDPVIPYEITVENNGPPQSGLVVTEIVPAYTVFVPAESTPGWVCEPGPDEGSACRFAIGELATGGGRTLIFATRVLAGTPAEVEIYDEAFLDFESSLAARGLTTEHRTCIVDSGGICTLWVSSFRDLGCLCLFNLCED